MSSEDQPTPPVDLPADIVDTLEECSPTRLREIAAYAEALADYSERHDGEEEGPARNDGEEKGRARPDDETVPEGVPAKATITIKEINNNRYYYWQWRDGDRVRSKYKGPVGDEE